MTKQLGERVSVLEQSLIALSENLKEWRKEDRLYREQLADEMKTLHGELRSTGTPTDWKAIGSAIVMTAGVMSALMAGANFWYSAKAGPTEQAVTRIEQQLKDQSPMVLRYRVDELERKLRLDNPRN